MLVGVRRSLASLENVVSTSVFLTTEASSDVRDDITDCPLLEPVRQAVGGRFDRPQASSDGGAVLLKAAERVYGLVKAFALCLVDQRAPAKTRHTLAELIGQHVFGIACGHPDGNDADRLGAGPDAQAAGRARPGVGHLAGIAADAVAVREWRGTSGIVPAGTPGPRPPVVDQEPPFACGGIRTERNGRSITLLFSVVYRTTLAAVYSSVHNSRLD